MRKATPDDLLVDLVSTVDPGLGAMFGPVRDGERVQQIGVELLSPNPFQHRSAGIAEDDASLIELSTDIAQHGIIQPLIVRRNGTAQTYQVAAGHRRLAAAIMAGLASVPCVVRPLDDDAMLDVVFAENYHRTDVNPIDRAQLIALLVERGLSRQEISERLSIGLPAISNALRLLRAPAEAKQAVVRGEISERQLAALAPIFDVPEAVRPYLPLYCNVESMIQRAKNGASSDVLRTEAASALRIATRELPEHWRNRRFDDGGIVQPVCSGCPQTIAVGGSERCINPNCWNIKSSAYRGLENRAAVEATGIPMEPEKVDYNQRNRFYSRDAKLLGVPPHGTFTCPNLRLSRSHFGEAVHGELGVICFNAKGGPCKCLAAIQRAQAKDGNAQWRAIVDDTSAALAARLVAVDLQILRLVAFQLTDWQHEQNVSSLTAQECADLIVETMIKRRTPYDPHKNVETGRTAMEQMLALAGVRAPWLPPDAPQLTAR